MGPIVFLGDSITDGDRDRDDPASLGDGYVRVVADGLRAAGDQRTVVNVGIGGDRVPDLLARFDRDVVAQQPHWLSIYVGINDTWRRYDRDDPTTLEQFAAGAEHGNSWATTDGVHPTAAGAELIARAWLTAVG